MNKLILISIFNCLIVAWTGCDYFKKERNSRSAEERIYDWGKPWIEDQIKDSNAVYFPPNDLNANSFTYEFQKFFDKNSNVPIVMKAKLIDLEKRDGGDIFAEFVCYLSSEPYWTNEAMRFRLAVSEKMVDKIFKDRSFEREGKDYDEIHSELFSDYPESNYFIVVKIDGFKKIRRYEIEGELLEFGNFEPPDYYIDINVLKEPSYISFGELIRFIHIDVGGYPPMPNAIRDLLKDRFNKKS